MSHFFQRNLKRTYPVVAKAQGVWVWDGEGNKFLDGCSGAIVSNLGHGLAPVAEAISEQLSRVAFAHTSQFVSRPALELSDRLVELAPDNFASRARVYFTSGGSESVETAVKLARSFFVERGQKERSIFLSRRCSYHGSTLGALSLTGHPSRKAPYLPLLNDWARVEADYRYRCRCGAGPGPCRSQSCSIACADDLERAILESGPERVAAFVAEPIVGAALGAAEPGADYWPRAREICTRYGVLLIADEVMTGLGRTGTKFGVDLWGVQPDIIALGKGLSAGYLPLGAVLACDEVAAAVEEGSGVFEHGFTYSGHPVSCAAGLAVIDYLVSERLDSRVADMEDEFFAGLRCLQDEFDFVGDVRGRGFLAGLELVRHRESKEPFDADLKASQVVATEAAARGLIVYPGSGFVAGGRGDHIMVAPPFVISREELSLLFERLAEALKAAGARLTAGAGAERAGGR